MKTNQFFVAAINLLGIFALSGCAASWPKATLSSNIPFFYGGVIQVQNSVPNTVIIPQSRGDGFVIEVSTGKRSPWCLWLCRERIPIRVATLIIGQSLTLPLYRNTNNQTVYIPFAVKVIEAQRDEETEEVQTEIIGFYNECYAVPPYRDSNFTFNFDPPKMEALKRGYTGHGCGGSYSYFW